MISRATKIKIEMLKMGVTGAAIAQRLGVTRVAIYHVIEGRRPSARIRHAIAEAVGLKVSDLWSEKNKRKAV